MKFEVGAKVTFKNLNYPHEGKISVLLTASNIVYVRWDNALRNGWYKKNDLEIVPPGGHYENR